MPEYAFDITLAAVARVTAPDEKTAIEKIYEIECIDLNCEVGSVRLTEASLDGRPDLFEINP